MRPVDFHSEARQEFLDEVKYYASTRKGLAMQFAEAVSATVDLMQRHPFGGAPRADNARSVRVKGFPFNVTYRVDERRLLIVAIAGHKRKPGHWLTRASQAQ